MDPSIYLVDDENKSPSGVHAENKEVNPVSLASDDNTAAQAKEIHVGSGDTDERNGDSRILSPNEIVSDDQVNSMSSLSLIESITGQKG